MNDFIRAVQQVEAAAPGSDPVAVLRMLREVAGLNDAFIQHFLGDARSATVELDAGLSDYIRRAVQHGVKEDGTEEGVVLTSDGTTVAPAPLLLGVEAGLLSKNKGPVRGLYQLTLARALDLSLRAQQLGPDGCWDSVSSPGVFTLSGSPSPLTTAQLHGGMDGAVLGMAAFSGGPVQTLSSLLTEYYSQQLGAGGLDTAPALISRRRRQNTKRLLSLPLLGRQVLRAVELQRRLSGRSKMEAKQKRQLAATVKEGLKEFVHQYLGEHQRRPNKKMKPLRGFEVLRFKVYATFG